MEPWNVLLTGFEPFGELPTNPSQAVVEALQGRTIAGSRIEGVVLPCVFEEAPRRLQSAIRRLKPVAVVCLGLAHRSRVLRLERRATNWVQARIPDNAGRQPRGIPVIRGGPSRHTGTLPAREILDAWVRASLPGRLSDSAGGYVCNHLYYHLLHLLHTRSIPAGFIHLPPIPREPRQRRQAERDQVRAITLAIEATLRARAGQGAKRKSATSPS